VRERVVSMLRNVAEPLACGVAEGLGMPLPDAMPKALPKPPKAEVATSPALSMSSYPGDGSIRTRKVAIMVAPGVDAADVAAIQERLAREGAVARLVASRIGPCPATGKKSLDADASFENEPAV